MSFGEIDVEGEHDGREPGEDDEDGADAEPSLCGVTASAKGCDTDREDDVIDNQRGSTPAAPLATARARYHRNRSNVRSPDGRRVDLADIPSNVTTIAG